MCKDRLYDVWAADDVDPNLLWATLNSTVVALSKHQFGRAAGIEGNLDTHVIDVNAMLVPDVRKASPEAASRAVAACQEMSSRAAQSYLHDEFHLQDRRSLDDVTLEILGILDPQNVLQFCKTFTATSLTYKRRRVNVKSSPSRTAAAPTGPPHLRRKTLRTSFGPKPPNIGLLAFPEDFVSNRNQGEWIDLPTGTVEVGTALIDQHVSSSPALYA